ncbi:hyaluronidase-1 [Hoplias malabaricus]|uniref:hyaluronidase-1 n=1 Tax=Hoplias malabaricus TaxID=27720 RepID=UPI00346355A7
MDAKACWTSPLIFLCLFTTSPVLARPLKSLPHLPFFTVWNAPTELCESRYGVDLDLSVFDIVHNKNQTFAGGNITIFYSGKLGLYPYYDFQNKSVNGGVPQNASLKDHIWQADNDLRKVIPDKNFDGLAVVDWESWRPLWERNWDSKEVYWKGSRELVRIKHPHWEPARIEAEAMKEFEQAARSFMQETLKLGLRERQKGLWGFYGFPCCYNYEYKKNGTYTGQCPALEMKRNNRLLWLWNTSTALYPDIYLDLKLRNRGRDILLYSRHRVLEGLRVREQVTPVKPPVIPYARIVFTYTLEFLSQEDLVHTIGESVALGAAGIVLWGDSNFSKNKVTCLAVKDYIDTTLGQYVVNVTEAASMCSQTLCSSHGRCQRKNTNSTAFLHLDPAEWTIIHRTHRAHGDVSSPSYVIQRKVNTEKRENKSYTDQFKCQCFHGWEGEHCQNPVAN